MVTFYITEFLLRNDNYFYYIDIYKMRHEEETFKSYITFI